MSIWGRTYEWEFNDSDLDMIQNVVLSLSKEEWNKLVDEIKAATCLTSVYSDMVATTENVSKNEFLDSVNICLKIFENKYEEVSKKTIYNQD